MRLQVRDLLAEGGFLDVQLVFQKPLSCYKTFKDIGIPEGAKLPDSNAFPFSAPDIPNGRNLWFLAPKVLCPVSFYVWCLLLNCLFLIVGNQVVFADASLAGQHSV